MLVLVFVSAWSCCCCCCEGGGSEPFDALPMLVMAIVEVDRCDNFCDELCPLPLLVLLAGVASAGAGVGADAAAGMTLTE